MYVTEKDIVSELVSVCVCMCVTEDKNGDKVADASIWADGNNKLWQTAASVFG